jgi:hypothetical protein
MGRKKEQALRNPKASEVEFLRDSLEVLKLEMTRIDQYLRSREIEDDIGDEEMDRLKLRRQFVSDLHNYQETYAELTGLVTFYEKFNNQETKARKGFEPTGGADDVFEMLDREAIGDESAT